MTTPRRPAASCYDLFSRGAGDWLRHNNKVREAVRACLPELIVGPDLMSGASGRTVQVPVRLMQHARLRLSDAHLRSGAGQGAGQAGEVLLPAHSTPASGAGSGAMDDGAIRLLLEFSLDDIMDWLWQELRLPELKPTRRGALALPALVRVGWDKHGARSRLDRRRTIKAAILRRAMQRQAGGPAFTNDDLRFRQLLTREQPGTSAVVFFVIDVSASMTEAERKLAKAFFFIALQGLRRKYGRVETRFIAHTTRAWEFAEAEFFQVAGSGGTMASSAFKLALGLLGQQFAPARYNSYLFYASDGENFTEDRSAACQALTQLGAILNYVAYVETAPGMARAPETEMHRLWLELARRNLPLASSILSNTDDVWAAIRQFLVHQGASEEQT